MNLCNKWIYSIFLTILFLLLSSSFSYSITNKLFKNTLYKKCPTLFGIVIHSIILLFLIRITIFKNFMEGAEYNKELKDEMKSLSKKYHDEKTSLNLRRIEHYQRWANDEDALNRDKDWLEKYFGSITIMNIMKELENLKKLYITNP